MSKILAMFLATIVTLILSKDSLPNRTWVRVRTSPCKTNPAWAKDSKRIKLGSVYFDASNNVYTTATKGNNEATNQGGLTIYKANGCAK